MAEKKRSMAEQLKLTRDHDDELTFAPKTLDYAMS